MENPNDFLLKLDGQKFTDSCRLTGARTRQTTEPVCTSLCRQQRLFCMLIYHYEQILPDLQAEYLRLNGRKSLSAEEVTAKEKIYQKIQLVCDLIKNTGLMVHTLIIANLIDKGAPNGDYLICYDGSVVQMTDGSMRPLGKGFYSTPVTLKYPTGIGTYSLATPQQEAGHAEKHAGCAGGGCGDGSCDGGCPKDHQ